MTTPAQVRTRNRRRVTHPMPSDAPITAADGPWITIWLANIDTADRRDAHKLNDLAMRSLLGCADDRHRSNRFVQSALKRRLKRLDDLDKIGACGYAATLHRNVLYHALARGSSFGVVGPPSVDFGGIVANFLAGSHITVDAGVAPQ